MLSTLARPAGRSHRPGGHARCGGRHRRARGTPGDIRRRRTVEHLADRTWSRYSGTIDSSLSMATIRGSTPRSRDEARLHALDVDLQVHAVGGPARARPGAPAERARPRHSGTQARPRDGAPPCRAASCSRRCATCNSASPSRLRARGGGRSRAGPRPRPPRARRTPHRAARTTRSGLRSTRAELPCELATVRSDVELRRHAGVAQYPQAPRGCHAGRCAFAHVESRQRRMAACTRSSAFAVLEHGDRRV
jgi:hypothetical protein